MSEHKAVPNIRFKGFEDKWKDTIIGKLVKVYDGVHQTPKYKNNGVPFVSVENISNLYTNKFISKSDFENNFKNSKPTSGDLLMTRIGDVGTVNLVKNDNDLAYYVSLALLKPKIKDRKKYINSYFLMYLIESPRTKKELWKRTLHIAFPKKINKNEISKVNLCICLNWKEQQKIGNFFAKLDKLFDLQQQKIGKLELLKKALLQKLFPRHDAQIPEFRFNGYKKDWEEDLIGNVSTSKSGGTPSIAEKEYYDGNIPFIRSSDINKSRTELCINDNAVKHSSTFIVEKGSVLYALYGATSGQVALSKVKGAINQAVLAIFPKNYIEKKFLMYWFIYSKKKIVSKYLQGGQGNLSAKIIKNLIFCFPNKSEQQKIGNLLSKVDQLIELENKKLQNFQQVKKCLLKNMFVE